jgi:predicted DNA-binding transcriptional regulator AlpA
MNSSNQGVETERPKRRPKREVWPRGLRRVDAADYVGVSPSLFDSWIKDGVLPKPRKRGGVVLWDRFALDAAMEAIFYPEAEAEMAVWDEVRV